MKIFTFKTNGEVLGLRSKFVYRVLDDVLPEPICLMPEYYLGLIYYRGELFDTIDIGLLLDNASASFQESRRLIVIRWEDKKMAVAPGIIHGLVWFQYEDDPLKTKDGATIQLISPEALWDQALDKIKGTHESR